MRRRFRLAVGITGIVMMLAACSSEAASDVRIELVEPEPAEWVMGNFTATGGAVDDGVVCREGEAFYQDVGTETTFDRYYFFTCADGSGTFNLRVSGVLDQAYEDGIRAAVETGDLWEDATWATLPAGGSGDYGFLDGGGVHAGQVLEAGVAPLDGGGIREVFTGDLTR
jgi:hypothetical protein